MTMKSLEIFEITLYITIRELSRSAGRYKVSLSNMSLYPKYGVYKILLEISGPKKSVVFNDLSLKSVSLNPKFTVYIYTSPSVSVASRRITLSQSPLRELCSFIFGTTRLEQQPLHVLSSMLRMNSSLVIPTRLNVYELFA